METNNNSEESLWHSTEITEDDALKHLYDLMMTGEVHTNNGGSVYLDLTYDMEKIKKFMDSSKGESIELVLKGGYENGLANLEERLVEGKTTYFTIPPKDLDVRETRRLCLEIAKIASNSKKQILSRNKQGSVK